MYDVSSVSDGADADVCVNKKDLRIKEPTVKNVSKSSSPVDESPDSCFCSKVINGFFANDSEGCGIPSIKVIKSLRAENGWTHYHNKEGQDILNHWSKKAVLDAFRPQDKEWERKIIDRGNKLFKQTLEYLLN